MKKIIIYISVLAFACFFSCDDATDIDQVGRLDPDAAFRNVSDLQGGLIALYGQMDKSNEIWFSSAFTDIGAPGEQNGGQNLGIYSGDLNVGSGIAAAIWINSYRSIALANRIIAAAENITPADGEQETLDQILGQVYSIRAYHHFNLLTYYSVDYSDGSTGIINVDFVPSGFDIRPRNTVGENFSLIESDLATAQGLLGGFNDGVRFINTNFVTAMRARIAAYRQDYATADALASQLLTTFSVSDQTQFQNMWLTDSDVPEVIFELERTIGDNYDNQATGGGGWLGSIFAFINSTSTGGPFWEMDRSFYNSFDANDIRLATYIDPSSTIALDWNTTTDYRNSDVLLVRKYPGSEGQPLMNDIKIFRAAEMHLIRAEAQAALGNLTQAANLIKELRDVRLGAGQPLPTYANATQAFADILDERKKELAYEGHRYLDLKRLGARAGVQLSKEDRDCVSNGNFCVLPTSDYRFTFPIPNAEIAANPTIEQNPGY